MDFEKDTMEWINLWKVVLLLQEHDITLKPDRTNSNEYAKDFIQREANKKAALKISLQYKMGDCQLMAVGHAHWLAVVPPAKLYIYKIQRTE